jgi:hypothetical protein
MKPNNPFLIKGYVTPQYFCNRSSETQVITDNILSGVDTTLFSLRRMGKTGLVQHVGYLLGEQKKIKFIYTDIYSCENLNDLVLRLGNSLLQQDAPQQNILKWLSSIFRSIKPVISYDEISGSPEISIEYMTAKQSLGTLDDIFNYLKKQKKRYVWAIDEFQQIVQFPEKKVEALLRGHTQLLNNVSFIFSGSRKDMLFSIFSDSKRPFYQSTQMMELKEIEEPLYRKFIVKHFAGGKKKITKEALDTLFDLSYNHTWYVQMICNKLYFMPYAIITDEHVRNAVDQLIKQFESVYFNYRSMLTALQWRVLKSIAREGKVFAPNSKDFIQQYKLGTAPSVNRVLTSLIEQEHISKIYINANQSYFRLNDIFLLHWLQSGYD